jgi:integrase
MSTATIIEGTYPSGQRYWMVQAFVGRRRTRRYYTDKEKADAEKERIDNSSAEALQIPESILHEAWQCHKLLAAQGWTLRDATDHVLKRVIRFQDQPKIRELIDMYLKEEEESGIAPETLRDLRSRLAKPSRRFGDRWAHEVTSDEIKAWLSDMKKVEGLSARSRCHYLSKASQFFIWCVANKRCAENPLAVVKRPKVDTGEIQFFDVAQCRRILELAPKYGLYHYMVLGLFPGIRPTELRRLRAEFIRLDRRLIILNAVATKKTRRRFVEVFAGDTFGDCLFDWVSARPLSEKVFEGSDSTFVRRFRQLRDVLDFEWIQDGLRHTAATYHFAYYGDAAKTAALLGERDVRTLLEHYKGLASRAEAEQFYALRPNIVYGDSTAMQNDISAGGASS